mmetsp:Transcript_22293/g.56525  ORF Transcript_22293/g.56525 Transcript_22293/m.56525 type:complete len:206 (-) Transcript_22293:66-683(-)
MEANSPSKAASSNLSSSARCTPAILRAATSAAHVRFSSSWINLFISARSRSRSAALCARCASRCASPISASSGSAAAAGGATAGAASFVAAELLALALAPPAFLLGCTTLPADLALGCSLAASAALALAAGAAPTTAAPAIFLGAAIPSAADFFALSTACAVFVDAIRCARASARIASFCSPVSGPSSTLPHGAIAIGLLGKLPP